jgi:hypothetical protein
MGRILSNDILTIDGTRIPYKSNTLKPVRGKSKGSVQTASLGGGATNKDISVDDSTNFDKVEFEMNNTLENQELRSLWINKFNANVGIEIEVGSNDVYKNMYYTAENEEERKHEGTIKIMFEGGQDGI